MSWRPAMSRKVSEACAEIFLVFRAASSALRVQTIGGAQVRKTQLTGTWRRRFGQPVPAGADAFFIGSHGIKQGFGCGPVDCGQFLQRLLVIGQLEAGVLQALAGRLRIEIHFLGKRGER